MVISIYAPPASSLQTPAETRAPGVHLADQKLLSCSCELREAPLGAIRALKFLLGDRNLFNGQLKQGVPEFSVRVEGVHKIRFADAAFGTDDIG